MHSCYCICVSLTADEDVGGSRSAVERLPAPWTQLALGYWPALSAHVCWEEDPYVVLEFV